MKFWRIYKWSLWCWASRHCSQIRCQFRPETVQVIHKKKKLKRGVYLIVCFLAVINLGLFLSRLRRSLVVYWSWEWLQPCYLGHQDLTLSSNDKWCNLWCSCLVKDGCSRKSTQITRCPAVILGLEFCYFFFLLHLNLNLSNGLDTILLKPSPCHALTFFLWLAWDK